LTVGATAGVAVLGLGNVLMEDDALGPHVIQALQSQYEFPDDVTVEDLGTPGLDLAPFLMGYRAAIFVDAVHAEAPPGTVLTYTREQILKVAPPPRVSNHDPALKESLLSMEFAGLGPKDILFVGVVPASTTTRVGLTPAVRAAIPTAIDAVLAELSRLGHPARRRDVPLVQLSWWEESAV
jgi:hydrogenase maturation protease